MKCLLSQVDVLLPICEIWKKYEIVLFIIYRIFHSSSKSPMGSIGQFITTFAKIRWYIILRFATHIYLFILLWVMLKFMVTMNQLNVIANPVERLFNFWGKEKKMHRTLVKELDSLINYLVNFYFVPFTKCQLYEDGTRYALLCSWVNNLL